MPTTWYKRKWVIFLLHISVWTLLFLFPILLQKSIQDTKGGTHKTCNKAWELYGLKTNPANATKQNTQEYLFVPVEYSLVKIVTANIVWIEGLKDYIKIHLHNTSKPIVTRMNMKAMEDDLPNSKFIRIHKSYIVSIDYITALRKSSVFIGDLELPVGENYRDAVATLTGK